MGIMTLRRFVMAGDPSPYMIGDITVYRKFIVDAYSSRIVVNHNIGLVPKFVTFHYDKPATDSANYLSDGLFNDVMGVASNLNNGRGNKYTYYVTTDPGESIGNASACFTDQSILIYRASSSAYFTERLTYTVEVYA